MELTKKQAEGLKIAIERYRNKEKYTTIAGYAGTGKSTLVRFIIDALNLDPQKDVCYIAYTGCAAQIMQHKGCPNVMTAHRLLYYSRQKKDGTFYHIPKDHIENYKIVVVDEISMLPKNMWDLLLSHKKHVIALGDPGQLPPIGEDNGILDRPHIFLDEIMRQAADSEIIRLSADIRARKAIKPYKGTEINIVRRKDMIDGMLTWADQVICGKNDTRNILNDYYRRMKWGEGVDLTTPLVGDRIICRKNNWKCVNKIGDALVNGSMGLLTKMEVANNPWLEKKCLINFLPDAYDDSPDIERMYAELLIDWKLITRNEPTVTKENFSMFPWHLLPEQFEYGYVITCWKAQGGEYEKVLFIAESVGRMDEAQYARYLYTGVTRASKKLTLVIL